MKFSAKQATALDELRLLVKAVHGPKASCGLYDQGVEINHSLGRMRFDCADLTEMVDQYRFMAQRAVDVAEAGEVPLTETVAEVAARAERCRALLGRVKP